MKKTVAMAMAVLTGTTMLAGISAAAEENHYPVTISTYNYEKEPVEVTFDSRPEKVLCTNQTQTELMLYFGLDDCIAGAAYLDGAIREDLQAQYDKLVADGKEMTVKSYPDKETVLALEPDMIFGWRSAFAEDALGDVSEWNDLGVGTMILRCSNNTAEELNINSVLADIADIGAVFDIEETTDAYIAEAQSMLDEVQAKVSELEAPLNVLIMEGMGEGSWYAWGANCLTGSLVESAGGVNLSAEGGDLSVEDIVNYNPDVIIVDYMDDMEAEDGGAAASAAAIEAVTGESALAEVPAVANGRIMAVNLTDVYGGGIRMVPSIEAMFDFMYGE